MKTENLTTMRMDAFERAYQLFLKTDRIHHSSKEVSTLAFERHLGLVHVANFQIIDRYVQYRIVNKDKFIVGKIKFKL
jgi:hypothetical protein